MPASTAAASPAVQQRHHTGGRNAPCHGRTCCAWRAPAAAATCCLRLPAHPPAAMESLLHTLPWLRLLQQGTAWHACHKVQSNDLTQLLHVKGLLQV